MKKLKSYQVLLLILIFVFSNIVFAQDDSVRTISRLSVPRGLEGRIEFWKLIFTKYGKNHRVFHNRSHPEVIYSVLDFSEFEERLSGKELLRAKEQEILREEDQIRSALHHLAAGGDPRTPFEERVYRLYKKLPRFSRSMFSEALEPDQIRYQTGIMERFQESLVRSGRYLKAIEHIFNEEGLPSELGRIPFIESSFDYTAYSSVGAAGIWQFMPATAKKYMTVSANIDERRDPIIATRGAAKYLRNAYEDTGSWALAVTSYNHGLAGILRAAREVGSNNIVDIIARYKAKSFGFASSNFFAEFLAALEIERNVNNYFPGLKREAPVEFCEIRLPKSMNISSLASYSHTTRDDIADLNLGLMKKIVEDRAPIPAGSYVKVPLRSQQYVSRVMPGIQIVSQSTQFKTELYNVQESTSEAQLAMDLPQSKKSEIDEDIIDESKNESGEEVIVLGEEIGPERSKSNNYRSTRSAIIVKRESDNRYRKLTKSRSNPSKDKATSTSKKNSKKTTKKSTNTKSIKTTNKTSKKKSK